MSTLRMCLAFAVIVASSCDSSMGLYKGVFSRSAMSSLGNSTSSSTAQSIDVFAGNDANTFVLQLPATSGFIMPFSATKQGDALSFAGGQIVSVATGSTTSTITLVMGSGTMTKNALNFTATTTETTAFGSLQSTSTVAYTFTGTKQ